MKRICTLFLFLIHLTCFGQIAMDCDSNFTLITNSGKLYGTLLHPHDEKKTPLVIIIAGSGPTDRDGNNPMMKNNSLKILAESLAQHGISSLRFDKRGIAASKKANAAESEMRFETGVNDVKEWIELLKKDKKYSSITLIGHSEGSLIGMLSSQNVDKYISIAGTGLSADSIIKIQLKSQPAQIKDICFPIINSLKQGKMVDSVSPMLYSLFRPSIQPYMISWFQYNPTDEIKKLKIPILILQGDNDLQVSVSDAELLHNAQPKSKLVIINQMNHVLKITSTEHSDNLKSYSDTSLPISEKLVKEIVEFIQQK